MARRPPRVTPLPYTTLFRSLICLSNSVPTIGRPVRPRSDPGSLLCRRVPNLHLLVALLPRVLRRWCVPTVGFRLLLRACLPARLRLVCQFFPLQLLSAIPDLQSAVFPLAHHHLRLGRGLPTPRRLHLQIPVLHRKNEA